MEESKKESIAVHYGIFKIQTKAIEGAYSPKESSAGFFTSQADICEIIVGHDLTFKSEEQAKAKLVSLPRPGMYVVLPVYVLI